MPGYPLPPQWVLHALREGTVISAHPLALTEKRSMDEQHQRALTRYYHAAGAGGLAVGVHTTQFEIRDPAHSLYGPVLALAAETALSCDAATGRRTVLVAGICGATDQALREAGFAREQGYHVGLLSLSALQDASDDALIEHCRAVAREIPLMGFYLQPAAGGRLLSRSYWCRFMEIPNVVAIKIAPFNRYHTLDVLRAVAESGRAKDVALYTGNDDSIVIDLLTPYAIPVGQGTVRLRIVGGLLGHWAFWTRRAVELLALCKLTWEHDAIPAQMLSLAQEVTDCNAAVFDAANSYAGAIPGIHEVLRRQGLMGSIHCLDRSLALSPGQSAEIDRVCSAYADLTDTEFVKENLSDWLR